MPSTPTSSSKWLSFSTEPCFQCERVDFCKTTCWTGQRLEQFVEWNIPQITYHLISVREIESSIIPIGSHGGGRALNWQGCGADGSMNWTKIFNHWLPGPLLLPSKSYSTKSSTWPSYWEDFVLNTKEAWEFVCFNHREFDKMHWEQ